MLRFGVVIAGKIEASVSASGFGMKDVIDDSGQYFRSQSLSTGEGGPLK